MHVWDEFSEFLPENRVPTSADFNTYPIQIFFHNTFFSKKINETYFECQSINQRGFTSSL